MITKTVSPPAVLPSEQHHDSKKTPNNDNNNADNNKTGNNNNNNKALNDGNNKSERKEIFAVKTELHPSANEPKPQSSDTKSKWLNIYQRICFL